MNKFAIFLLSTILILGFAQKLYIHSPNNTKPQVLSVRLSPIGFNPRSGQLDGRLVMAQPFDSCSPIDNVQNQQEDVFVLANDEGCLESIKAKNILKGGALVGIVKQNPNTTLHDKQLNIVHIPIVELAPRDFDNLVKMLTEAKDGPITATIQFGSGAILTDIVTELWMSPTETEIYTFLINMQKFLNNQKNEVTFKPCYAMHSQKQRKSFIGCYSNGMYCPGQLEYDGRIQGQNIIQESLRQIIIRQMGMDKWWKYIKYFYVQCLNNSEGDVFMSQKSLSICTKNSMMLAEIDHQEIQRQMNMSFLGPRKQVDDNLWLREQRQDYIKEKISQYPVMLINKKQFTSFEPDEIKMTICKMEHGRSEECSQIVDGKLQNSEVFLILGIVMMIVVFVLIGYKYVMYRRMQKEMRSEVTSTLEQYYRYMETLDGDNPVQPRIHKEKPQSLNSIEKHSAGMKQKDQAMEVEIQMSATNQPRGQKKRTTKQGHQNLVEEEN